jgi:hypothetical protein
MPNTLPRLTTEPTTASFNGTKHSLLEKLRVTQLIKKFPALDESCSFNSTFLKARPFCLSWFRSMQLMSPSYSLRINFNIKLPSRSRSSKGLLPSGFHNKNLHTPLLSTKHAVCPTHLIHLDRTNNVYCKQYRSYSSTLYSFLILDLIIQPLPVVRRSVCSSVMDWGDRILGELDCIVTILFGVYLVLCLF